MVKNPPANAGDISDTSSVSGSGKSSAGRHGNPLQYSCLQNPTDREAWQATVHRITTNRILLKQLSTRTHTLWSKHLDYYSKENREK